MRLIFLFVLFYELSQPSLSTSRTNSKPRVLPGHTSSSKSSIYYTTSATHPTIKATTSPEWITVESPSFSPDQARSHDKRPRSHILPHDEDIMFVTDVHYKGMKSRTTVSSPYHEQLSLPTLITRGVLDQGKGQVWMSKPSITSVTSAPNADSNTIYVTSNTLSISAKNVNEPTQPLFNGKSKNLMVSPTMKFLQTKTENTVDQFDTLECSKKGLAGQKKQCRKKC